jgi:hypothetical protein
MIFTLPKLSSRKQQSETKDGDAPGKKWFENKWEIFLRKAEKDCLGSYFSSYFYF